jgi:putative peptidoglycan lipid II flippase
MPILARHAARERMDEIRWLLTRLVGVAGFVFIPACFLLAGLGHELLSVVFERGAFGSEATRLTATALLCYSLGMLSFSTNPILTGVFFSLRDSITPLKASSVAFVINGVLDYLLMQVLGHAGIALATAATASGVSVVLWSGVRKRVGGIETRSVLNSLYKSLLAASAMLIAARLLVAACSRVGAAPWLGLTVGIAAGAGVYLVIQSILNRTTLQQVVRLLRRRGGASAASTQAAAPPSSPPP